MGHAAQYPLYANVLGCRASDRLAPARAKARGSKKINLQRKLALNIVTNGGARFIGSLLLVPLLFCAAAAAAASPPSIAFFYGAEPPWDELAAFDLVVVEPDHTPRPPRLTGGKTEVLAYMSVGEALASRAWFKDLPAAWRIGENPAWGSAVIDQSEPAWASFLVNRVARPLWEAGYRGFFLDTLDSYHLVAKTAEARAAQEAGLARVVRELKRAFPEAKLVFNRGFEILPQVKDVAHAVAAESLFRGWDPATKRYRDVPAADRDWLVTQLNRVRREYGLPAIAIDYVPPEERETARKTAADIRALGFVPWVSTSELDLLGVGAVEVMPRKVLMLYDREPGQEDLTYDDIHRFLALPLYHLGYVPEYRAVGVDPLPVHALAGRYAGVVTWFNSDQAPGSDDLVRLLQRAVRERVPIAAFGRFGIAAGHLESLLGIAAPGARVGAAKVTIATKSPLIGYEVEPLPDRREFIPLAARDATPLLRLKDDLGHVMDAVALTPWGGYALAPYAVLDFPGENASRWVVQPIEFLRRALALPAMPVPDVTTENGRRLLLVHVDGDGFPSRAEIPGAPFAGEVLLREVLERYRVPTTMSVIQGEISTTGLHANLAPTLEEIARRTFALPHVELASHSYSHPFRWRAAQGQPHERGFSLAIPNYAFDLDAEIRGSIKYIESRLAPPGKRVQVFLWTGDCVPSADAIARTYAARVLNMNGGYTTITKAHPSLTLVAPLGIPKGGHYQVYAPNQNENVYTNNWTGPFYGYERAIETFELTDAPYRLKPIDIYFHTYAATKRASLSALRKVYDWALAQRVHPVYASEYIRKALDFRRAVVARTPDGWLFRSGGDVRTLRIAQAAGSPDVAASRNVAGFARHNDQYYLHLASDDARVVLADRAPALPYLANANARLESMTQGGGELTLRLVGHMPLAFELENVRECAVSANGRPLKAVAGGALPRSALRFELKTDAAATISVRCRR
jgi:hypothetical protein